MKHKRKAMRMLVLFSLGVILPCVILLWLPLRHAYAFEHPEGGQKRVLVLSPVARESPIGIPMDDLYQKLLSEGLGGRLEFYREYLDSARFTVHDDYEMALRDFLVRKYKGVKLDLILTTEGGSLEFISRYASEIFPGTPVLYRGFKDRHLGPNFFAIVFEPTFKWTLESALELQPTTKQVYVICGVGATDRIYEAIARRQFQEFEGRCTFNYLIGLPLPGLLQTVAHLPVDSIIYYLVVSEDVEGNKFIGYEYLNKGISASANVPVYGFHEAMVGQGSVGGRVLGVETGTRLQAEQALRILNGERPATVSLDPAQMTVTVFDWRQLRRWGISEDRLPPGSVIRFKEPTFWEQYKWRIIFAIALIALQSMLIAFLLIERERSRRARKTLEKAQADLAHVSRVMTMGELVTSIAHEVNQPLTAIRTYGDASLRFLSAVPPNLEKLRDANERVILNATRASEVINRIRALVRKTEPEKARLNINEITREVVDLMQREMLNHRVQLHLELEPSIPDIEGDRIQLQQVVLNLILNGIEAMNAVNRRAKMLKIKSQGDSQGSVLITVSDTGVGLNPDDLNRVFDAFYSTKTEGIGMGLSISRAIIERHGGRLWATANGGDGAAFHFTLPV